MKKLLLFISVLFPALMQAAVVSPLHLNDVALTREGDVLQLNMQINPAQYHLSTNAQWEVTPIITSLDGLNSAVMPSFVVTGKNAYYYALRQGIDSQSSVLRSGKKESAPYSASLAWQDWMKMSKVDLVARKISCCGNDPRRSDNVTLPGLTQSVDTIPVARLSYDRPSYVPAFEYVVPIKDEVKQRKLSGRAYVNFIVNKTNIVPTYMNNMVELKKILNSIDSVRFNRDASVDTIRLTGYASPEGPYDNNVRLAAGRTEAVKQYVQNLYDFPAKVYFTASVPEDWEGLREYIARTDMTQKQEMLDYIDSSAHDPVRRNDLFARKFPKEYQFLLKNEYPWLRHTDYYIHYVVRQYTTIEEILEALHTNPSNLSLNEFFRAAAHYPQESREYRDVLEQAVSFYPNEPIANLNAANAAMSSGEYARAARYLNKAGGSAEATYSKGVLAALQGDYQKALPLFADAQKAGLEKASDAARQINDILDVHENIEYVCE